MPLSAGDRVDRYEIVSFLGSGGMGEVYRARDPKLQRDIALKVLHVDGALATDGRQRLLREARAVAALSHPNVLAVFDVGEVTEPEHLRGMTYIAMELIVGSALRAHFGDATVPMERRLGWLKDIARALAAAHEAGLVHRDVKPENVMIRVDGAVKVLDFGIARHVGKVDALSSTEGHSLSTINTDLGPPAPHVQIAASTRTAPGRIVGTLYYMAPEQLRGEAVDGRVDQFAWGVVAYELLTGKRPWVLGPDLIAIASQILSHTPRAPAEIEPQISPAISDVIMRALAKDAADRFPTMGELLAGLEEAASGGRDRGRRLPPPWRKATHLREGSASPRRRWITYALGASALVGAIDVALYVARARHGSPAIAMTPSSLASDGCTSSAACARAHGGGPWHCQSVRHECVPMDSVDCKAIAEPGDPMNEETVWIGALYPTTGPEAGQFSSERRALELARQDFATALGSSANSTTTRARPLGVVLCDESADAVRAAKHLATEVEAPAVVGFRSASTAALVIPSVFRPRGVLSLIAISQAPDLTRIPEPAGEARLIWRSTLNAKDVAAPLAALVADVLEPQARSGSPDTSLRVAMTRSHRIYDVADEIFRVLQFNGKSALLNGNDFRQFVIEGAIDAGTSSVFDAMADFRPQVIFLFGLTFASNVLEPLEDRWGAGRRPTYLIGSGEWGNEFLLFAGKDPQRRHRFFGVTNMSTRMTNAQLVLHYNRAFPTEPVLRTNAPSPSYDAFYALAYAIIALGDEPITGPSLSRALDRLQPPGRPIDVGPQSIFDAFTTLRSGQNIDLNGAIGNLDFNRETGEAPIDYAIVCLGVDDHGAASGAVESGLVYDATTKKLVGTMHCP